MRFATGPPGSVEVAAAQVGFFGVFDFQFQFSPLGFFETKLRASLTLSILFSLFPFLVHRQQQSQLSQGHSPCSSNTYSERSNSSNGGFNINEEEAGSSSSERRRRRCRHRRLLINNKSSTNRAILLTWILAVFFSKEK
jgi:hypothetical protein